VQSAPVAGADAPVTGFLVEELASAVEAPVGATAASAGAIATPPNPRGRGSEAFLT
jgi:hypothetical protein